MDYVFYENTILNKLIVSSMNIFANLVEDNFIPIEDDLFTIETFSPPAEEVDKIFIIFSSKINLCTLDSIHKNLTEKKYIKIFYMIKDEIEYTENFLNWYTSWSVTKDALINYGVDENLLSLIYEYYSMRLPTVKHRRIVEYLKQYLHLIRAHFVSILVKESNFTSMESNGSNLINMQKYRLRKEINESKFIVIKNEYENIIEEEKQTMKRVVIIPSANVEAALDVLARRADCDCVALIEFNFLRQLVYVKEFGPTRCVFSAELFSNELYTCYSTNIGDFFSKVF